MKSFVFVVEVLRTDDNEPVITILRDPSGRVIEVPEDIDSSVNTFISGLYEKK